MIATTVAPSCTGCEKTVRQARRCVSCRAIKADLQNLADAIIELKYQHKSKRG